MPAMPPLWKATLTCVPKLADAISALFEEIALLVASFCPPRTPTAEIEAIFGAPPDREALQAQIAVLAALHDAPCPTVAVAEVGNLDWIKKVAEDFPPLPIGPFLIYGAAYRDQAKTARLGLQIDATSAFGTGEHPTTRGCLCLLARLAKKTRPRNVLDMGCGSGILAMAAAKLCHAPALGIDCDPVSVAIATQNARLNGVAAGTRFERSLGYRSQTVKERAPYDLILANIFAVPLCRMAKDLKRHLAPKGHAILAGLLTQQANAVVAAHRAQGLYVVDRRIDGEWTILLLQND
jgi:ribosomal protein L11 methyltransferase